MESSDSGCAAAAVIFGLECVTVLDSLRADYLNGSLHPFVEMCEIIEWPRAAR